MVGDAQATQRRLLEAAAQEFAARGIAGARVDRIAEAARSNKAQIYHYFGSKDELFDAVFNSLVADTLHEVPIDVTDLPEYAGRLFDRYERDPQVPRLATWYRLERAGTQAPLEAIVKSNRDKVDAIARAQQAGDLPSHFAAADLLAVILAVAAMWTSITPEFTELTTAHTAASQGEHRPVPPAGVPAAARGGPALPGAHRR
jgi:AcrR family transcriptional regulator